MSDVLEDRVLKGLHRQYCYNCKKKRYFMFSEHITFILFKKTILYLLR